MGNLFQGATNFNVNISNWNIGNVSFMDFIFYNASSFDQKLCWNITAATTTNSMFDHSSGYILPSCGGNCSSELLCA